MQKSDLPKVFTIDPTEGRWRQRLSDAERNIPIYHAVVVPPPITAGDPLKGAFFRVYVEGPITDEWIDVKPGTLPEALKNIALHLEHHIGTLAAINGVMQGGR